MNIPEKLTSSGIFWLILVAVGTAILIFLLRLIVLHFGGWDIFPEFKITFSDVVTIIALIAATIILPKIIQGSIDKKGRYRSILLKESETIKEKINQLKRIIDKMNMDKTSKMPKEEKISIDIKMLEVFNSSNLLYSKADDSKFTYNKEWHDKILDLRDIVSEYLEQDKTLNDASYKLINDKISECINNINEYTFDILME